MITKHPMRIAAAKLENLTIDIEINTSLKKSVLLSYLGETQNSGEIVSTLTISCVRKGFMTCDQRCQ